MNNESSELIKSNSLSNYNTPSDGLYFFAILYKHKIFILAITLIAAIVSIIAALNMPVWYASTVSFVPPRENEDPSASGLNTALRGLGLASSLTRKRSLEYSMMVFFTSNAVVDSVIKKYNIAELYDIPETEITNLRKAFQGNVDVDLTDNGNYELTVWDTDKNLAAEIANDYVEITNALAARIYREEIDVNVEYLVKRINSIDSTIIEITNELAKLTRTKNIFSPDDQAKAASAALGEIKSLSMQYEMLYNVYKNNFGDDDPTTLTLKELVNSANNKVKESYSKPGLVGNFSLKEATPIAVSYLTKYADIEALTKTKAMLITSLEKTLLDSRKNIQNFFIVDKAIPADKKDKPKRSFIVAGATLGGFILSILFVLLMNGFKIAVKQANLINEMN